MSTQTEEQLNLLNDPANDDQTFEEWFLALPVHEPFHVKPSDNVRHAWYEGEPWR